MVSAPEKLRRLARSVQALSAPVGPQWPRLRSAVCAEKALWKKAANMMSEPNTRSGALEELAGLSAFDPRALVRCIRGGGRDIEAGGPPTAQKPSASFVDKRKASLASVVRPRLADSLKQQQKLK